MLMVCRWSDTLTAMPPYYQSTDYYYYTDDGMKTLQKINRFVINIHFIPVGIDTWFLYRSVYFCVLS